MPFIVLSTGKRTEVDSVDFLRLGHLKWQETSGYASRSRRCGGQTKTMFLHRVICPIDGEVDHINGNPLDNRRANLRPASRAQQNQNSRGRVRVSLYKGVWEAPGGRWIAHIKAPGRKRHIGCFDSQEEAARAYDREASKFFGAFARLNFPIQTEASCTG